MSAQGWTAYNAGKYDEAVRLWRQSGDREAQFALGLAYDLGRGVPADSLAACRWYRGAGALGQVEAMFDTAVLYDSGRCGPRRADLAALWYARAAASGHGRAQFDLGQLYEAGDGVPRNADVAAAWYRMAALNGIAAAVGRVRLAPVEPGGELRPAESVAAEPDGEAVGGPDAVVLVWDAPAESQPVRFFVEVETEDHGAAREVEERYVDVTALRVSPRPPAPYAWRVITIDPATQHYAAAPWQPGEAAS